jgi:lipopolysaccharide export system permease protein
MLSNYEEMEAKYITTTGSSVNIARTGLWLRQKMDDGRITIIHADNIKMPEWLLSPVTAFFFEADSKMTHRIDSASAELNHGQWIFYNAWVNIVDDNNSKSQPTFYERLVLPTEITSSDIQRRFTSPRTVSFWRLPEYARIMQNTGFESNPLWSYFYGFLAEPFLNMALVFIAAAMALRAPRQQRGWWLVVGTLMIGFSVFFLGDFLSALGISERLPIVVAAFAPATITMLIGLTALLYLEEG